MSSQHIKKEILDRFVCQRSGNCCDQEGYVILSNREQSDIAEHLGISLTEFRQNYCERTHLGEWTLIDQPNSTKCIFFTKDRLCSIQPVKPEQCTEFPFKWTNCDAMEYCEGLQLAAKQLREEQK